jgi:hypothetical protein
MAWLIIESCLELDEVRAGAEGAARCIIGAPSASAICTLFVCYLPPQHEFLARPLLYWLCELLITRGKSPASNPNRRRRFSELQVPSQCDLHSSPRPSSECKATCDVIRRGGGRDCDCVRRVEGYKLPATTAFAFGRPLRRHRESGSTPAYLQAACTHHASPLASDRRPGRPRLAMVCD